MNEETMARVMNFVEAFFRLTKQLIGSRRIFRAGHVKYCRLALMLDKNCLCGR